MASLKPTRSEVMNLLRYDAETGVFIWRASHRTIVAGQVAGSTTQKGYRRIKIGVFPYPAHRLAWLYVHGEWPRGQIDHIDGDKSNNRISNLRLATPSQNAWNQSKRKINTSGFKGVSWNSSSKRKPWIATIGHEYRRINLGRFETKEEAHQAYQAAASKLHGEFARAS